jgi:hypothetical protein
LPDTDFTSFITTHPQATVRPERKRVASPSPAESWELPEAPATAHRRTSAADRAAGYSHAERRECSARDNQDIRRLRKGGRQDSQ